LNDKLEVHGEDGQDHRTTMSARDFAAFRLHPKKNTSTRGSSNVLCLGKTTKDYIVDYEGTIQN
jgi:hypothetical protein